MRQVKKVEETSTVESDSDSELGQGMAEAKEGYSKDKTKTRQLPLYGDVRLLGW